MGDLPYISFEQSGLIRIYHNIISVLYRYKNFKLNRGWAYNTYYMVHVGGYVLQMHK